MLRNFAEVLALFALPFIVYFLVVFIRGRAPEALAPDHARNMPRLVLAGIVTAIIGVLLIGALEDRKTGTYQPATFKDGKLVPGRLE